MVYLIKANVIPLLRNLVEAINAFALANEVNLKFETTLKEIAFEHHPEQIIPDLTQLLCQVITLTPQDFDVTVKVHLSDLPGGKSLQIDISNTGASLTHLPDIIEGLRNKVSVRTNENGGTLFRFAIPLDEEEAITSADRPVLPSEESTTVIPAFYQKLRKQLKSHFTSIQNLEKAAGARSRKEGVFLKKVNAVITAHLDQEGFDTVALAKALALSRSQLYRRLKPLISFSPAHYIRYVRLQKAKELLEKGDESIGDVAFRTGFSSQSHFTRAFKKQFGFNPSQIK